MHVKLGSGSAPNPHLFLIGVAMLTPTKIYVAPLQGSGGVAVSTMDNWMLRTVPILLAAALGSSAATLGIDVDGYLTASVSSEEMSIDENAGASAVVADLLVSGEDKAVSLLKYWSQSLSSFAGSFEMLLAEFGISGSSVVCVALAVTVLAFIFVRKAGGPSGGGNSSKRMSVLFLGPCGAGKTAMMHRLCHDRIVSTVTSMQACHYLYRVNRNGGESGGSGPSASLVDYPGHERLRGGVREELRKAERVVFVLDGSCLAWQIAAAAELFYDVLSDPLMEGCRGLLVALNKSDVKEAKTSRAKALLQKEMEKLRGTRDTLGTQGEEDQMPAALALGRPGQPFSLEVDSPCEVVMAGCSVKDGSLDAVADFVRASAR